MICPQIRGGDLPVLAVLPAGSEGMRGRSRECLCCLPGILRFGQIARRLGHQTGCSDG